MRFNGIATVILVSLLLVGCGRTQQATSVTIQALGNSGDTLYKAHPQPIWHFAITNNGSVWVHWASYVEEKGGKDTNFWYAGTWIEWPKGALAPGQGIRTNMIVPAAGHAWRPSVVFWSAGPTDEFWLNCQKDAKTNYDNWHD